MPRSRDPAAFPRGKDGKVCFLKSRFGQQQGDTLGSFLFCLGIQPILNAVHAKWPGLLVRAICDDIHVAGPDAEVALAFAFLREELAKIGLEFVVRPEEDPAACCRPWKTATTRTLLSAAASLGATPLRCRRMLCGSAEAWRSWAPSWAQTTGWLQQC